MRTNSLNNSFSLLNYKNLNRIGRYIATIAAILFLALPQAWGAITYKTELSAKAGTGGSVKLSNSSTEPTNTYDGSPIVVNANGAGNTNTYYAWAFPAPGYVWKSWKADENSKQGALITIETPQNDSVQAVICTAPTSNADANCDEKGGYNSWLFGDTRYATLRYYITANFEKITLTTRDVTFTPTNPSKNCSEYADTLTFTASPSCAEADIKGPTYEKISGNGTMEVTGWKVVDGTQVEVY